MCVRALDSSSDFFSNLRQLLFLFLGNGDADRGGKATASDAFLPLLGGLTNEKRKKAEKRPTELGGSRASERRFFSSNCGDGRRPEID